ncbi:MAG: zf-HC2 domain-containing protein [Nocardiopsaceae bacterium]|jgi:anti-sigma-K factor RskA|nr:zf-HC2 domain-containing protein [Nocardiopsaceae bacterium]
MNNEMTCEQVRELAPDLAIGIADGQERDAVLRHAATCPDCRRLVSELSEVVDDLLLLAPEHQPSPDFAAKTLAQITPPSPRPRQRASREAMRRVFGGSPWKTRFAVAASIVVAVAVGAGAVYQGTSADRHLAASYRSVLAQGHGSFFAAAQLRGPTGTLGRVFGYQGQPSWLFATLGRPAAQPQHFTVWLVTRDGRRLSLGNTVLGGTHDTWGGPIPVALTQVRQLSFESASGHTLVAHFNARSPWS